MQWMFKLNSLISQIAAAGQPASATSSAPEKLSVGENIKLFFVSLWDKISTWFVNIFFTLIYAIGKFVLNIVDFLAIAVKELAGQNAVTDLANIKKASQADMVFRFVFDSTVWTIFKAFIGLAVVLLIIFTIVALIKNEYDAFLGGAEDNSKGQIIKRMLTSTFMILIVPFTAFFGILLSNSVLTSIDRALGRRSQNSTIASEVFIASTYEANLYRKYADTGKRVPILYDFKSVSSDDLKLPNGAYSNAQLNSSMQSYLKKSAWERGFSTWWQFYTKTFFGFSEIENAEIEADSTTGDIVKWSDFFDKNMQVNQIEYYVMADMSDYLVRSRKSVYIVNAYALAQTYGLNDGKNGSTSPFYGYDKAGNITTSLESAEKLTFRVYYDSNLGLDMPGVENVDGRCFIDYSFNGSHDEADGAIYLLCTGSWQETSNGTEFVYTPVRSNATKVNYYSSEFWSDYLAGSQLVVARGCFNDEGFPTAIRENGGEIEFYRDEVRAPVLFDLLPQITYEPKEGKLNLLGVFNDAILTITGVDISELIPKVYFRDDAWNFFTKRTENVATLDGGQMYIDYNFADGIPLSGLVSVGDINVIVLIFGAVMLASVLGKAMFGLIGRVFDLVLLFITYPVFAATMPLDDGKRFSNWTQSFVGKTLGAYGLIIGLNLVFILLPVIAEFDAFFSLEFVTNNLRGSSLSPQTLTTLLNFGVWLMFYLVAFTFIQTGGKTISKLMGINENDDALATGEQVFGDVKNIIDKTTSVVSGKVVVDTAKKLAGDVGGFIPGSAVAAKYFNKDARTARKDDRKAKADIKSRKRELKDADAEKLAGRIQKDKDKAAEDKAKADKKKKEEKYKKMVSGSTEEEKK